MQIKNILQDAYGKKADYILDNRLCRYNPNIYSLSFLKNIECKNAVLILASLNSEIYQELKKNVMKYMDEENIIELVSMKNMIKNNKQERSGTTITKIGKYSSGPLCQEHHLIESIGAFCSIAIGCEVVENHSMRYLSTSPFIYKNKNINPALKMDYSESKDCEWYFEGVEPKGVVDKLSRIKIGNDVWLGRNVIITNGSNIGNGVIAGAGAVITKDVPDYAIVAGVPAKIIRYRYTPEQIKSLNEIQWWNWSDDEIRERFDDFYLPIEEFISKYQKNIFHEKEGADSENL